jgi:hypothetical protein
MQHVTHSTMQQFEIVHTNSYQVNQTSITVGPAFYVFVSKVTTYTSGGRNLEASAHLLSRAFVS